MFSIFVAILKSHKKNIYTLNIEKVKKADQTSRMLTNCQKFVIKIMRFQEHFAK